MPLAKWRAELFARECNPKRKAMKSFNGEKKQKARFLRCLDENYGLLFDSAEAAGICLIADHERWLREDPVYRTVFTTAKRNREDKMIQRGLVMLCNAVRRGDKATERWIAKRHGSEAVRFIKQGGNLK